MPATHTLNTKIEALNLLDLHDGDFNLVKSRLGIPLNTLRRWLVDEIQLRLQYDNRQYRYFARIKLELLNDFLEFSRDTMNKMMTGDLDGHTLSQLTYVLSSLLNQAKHLEKSFEDLPPNPETDTEQANRIRYVYEEDLGAAPPWADEAPEQPNRMRYVYEEDLGAAPPHADETPEQPSPTQSSGAELSDAWLDLTRSGKGPKKSKRRPKVMPHQSARKRRKRPKKRQ